MNTSTSSNGGGLVHAPSWPNCQCFTCAKDRLRALIRETEQLAHRIRACVGGCPECQADARANR